MKSQEAIARYRRQLAEDTEFIELKGIPLPRDREGRQRDLSLPMDKVYIRLLTYKEETRLRLEAEEMSQIEEGFGDGVNSIEDGAVKALAHHLYARGKEYPEAERPSMVDPQEALKSDHRLVVLGAPGAGKSTMLRYLARMAAKDSEAPVPILVKLKYFASHCEREGKTSLRHFALSSAAEGDPDLLVLIHRKFTLFSTACTILCF